MIKVDKFIDADGNESFDCYDDFITATSYGRVVGGGRTEQEARDDLRARLILQLNALGQQISAISKALR